MMNLLVHHCCCFLQAALKAAWLPEQDRRRRLERFFLASDPSTASGVNPIVAAAAIKSHVKQRLRGACIYTVIQLFIICNNILFEMNVVDRVCEWYQRPDVQYLVFQINQSTN